MGEVEEVEEGFWPPSSPKGGRPSGPGLPPPSPSRRGPEAPRERVRTLVVPSLRVDAVGAKGFGVSRSYFAQGVKAGKVRLKGRPASPKDELAPGDLLFAEGLGTLRLLEVVGKTVRGNYKIKVEVER